MTADGTEYADEAFIALPTTETRTAAPTYEASDASFALGRRG